MNIEGYYFFFRYNFVGKIFVSMGLRYGLASKEIEVEVGGVEFGFFIIYVKLGVVWDFTVFVLVSFMVTLYKLKFLERRGF